MHLSNASAKSHASQHCFSKVSCISALLQQSLMHLSTASAKSHASQHCFSKVSCISALLQQNLMHLSTAVRLDTAAAAAAKYAASACAKL
jgi:hypothetical protein